MDDELKNFTKVWTWAFLCLTYAYFISSKLPKGLLRLISLLPVLYLFTVTFPLSLHSVHLGAPTAFFLSWLATFKLLLFSLDLPPLSPPPPSLLHFTSLASLPVKLKPRENDSKFLQSTETIQYQIRDRSSKEQTTFLPRPSILFALKFILLLALFNVYDYRPFIHPLLIHALHCLHLYLELEFFLTLVAVPARTLLGFELEPQFDEPYLSTSLQDFWGRRWNLIVTGILRPTVYLPVRRVGEGVVGRRWAALPAVVASFVVSGLMHEVIYYYLTRARPTWEVTWFFVIHGVCVAAEVAVKKWVREREKGWGWLWLSPVVSGPLTVGFVAVTGLWLFFPQVVRNGVIERIVGEYSIFVGFLWSRFNTVFSLFFSES
ncbi:unnamed protein product [Linum trigynum]|uniref:Wax synthase domain-containing protein n=1 Tax=Linum trigynum TaxID=586398 RepID=A0AAV2CDX0_9ROSI